jgi:hypothetical protein
MADDIPAMLADLAEHVEADWTGLLAAEYYEGRRTARQGGPPEGSKKFAHKKYQDSLDRLAVINALRPGALPHVEADDPATGIRRLRRELLGYRRPPQAPPKPARRRRVPAGPTPVLRHPREIPPEPQPELKTTPLSRAEMVRVIAEEGGSVLYDGRIITRVDDLPAEPVSAASPPPTDPATPEEQDDPPKPEWSDRDNQLRYRGKLVHRFRKDAHHQIAILNEFNSTGWTAPARGPLPCGDETAYVDAAKYLKKQSERKRWPIVFTRNNLEINWRPR